jgi:transposase-like protein
MKGPVQKETHHAEETPPVHSRVQGSGCPRRPDRLPSPAEACRKQGLSPHLLTSWKATFWARAASVFQAEAPREEDQARLAKLEQLVGRLTPEKELLKDAALRLTGASIRNGNGLLSLEEDASIPRLCEVLGVARSSSSHNPRRVRTGRCATP